MNDASDATDPHVEVYRGMDEAAVEMLESMLQTEGLEPRRLGRANAALVGVGMYAVEQRIEVPAEHAERARALIAEFERGADPAQVKALEQQALHTAPPAEERDEQAGFGARRVALWFVVLAVFGALLWFSR